MKFFIIIMLLVFSLSACGTAENDNNDTGKLNVGTGIAFESGDAANAGNSAISNAELTAADLQGKTETVAKILKHADVYSTPSNNATSIGALDANMNVSVYGLTEDQTWMVVSFNGRVGYIAANAFESEVVQNQTVIVPTPPTPNTNTGNTNTGNTNTGNTNTGNTNMGNTNTGNTNTGNTNTGNTNTGNTNTGNTNTGSSENSGSGNSAPPSAEKPVQLPGSGNSNEEPNANKPIQLPGSVTPGGGSPETPGGGSSETPGGGDSNGGEEEPPEPDTPDEPEETPDGPNALSEGN